MDCSMVFSKSSSIFDIFFSFCYLNFIQQHYNAVHCIKICYPLDNEKRGIAILSGETQNPSTETIFFISVALNMTLSEFYNDKLFDIDNIDDN